MNLNELRKEIKFVADAFGLRIALLDVARDGEVTIKLSKPTKEAPHGDQK